MLHRFTVKGYLEIIFFNFNFNFLLISIPVLRMNTETMCVLSKSVNKIQFGPPGYFAHIYVTTPIVSASKNYYR
jgi:hypothetical protein